MSDEKHHIVPYYVYVLVLIGLISLTFLSIAITGINLGSLTVAGALSFAVVKTILVLNWFMHLKYDKPYIVLMVAFVFLTFIVTIVLTFIDYIYR